MKLVTHPEEVYPNLAHLPCRTLPRTSKLYRASILTAFSAVLALNIAGCIFSPERSAKRKPPPPRVYPVLAHPYDVLLALELAYGNRDSVEYKTLYDSSYVGTSTDFTDPVGTLPESFRYADEVAHIAGLAKSTTIYDVSMSLGPPSSWIRSPSDDLSYPDWAIIQISGRSFDVQVTDGPQTYQATGENESFEFAFKPTTPEASSPTDTLWKIVRWRETNNR